MKNSERLLGSVRAVMCRWPLADLGNRLTFLRNLLFMHRIIIASENLLEVAAAKASESLRAYYLDHLEEERRHDEWLAEDLACADIDVHSCAYDSMAVATAGAQYYLINHVDPAALLGYMAVLECFPMPLDQLEWLESIHGSKLCRTLRHHAIHDVSHAADLLAVIDSIDARRFDLISQNAVQTAANIGAAIATFEVQS